MSDDRGALIKWKFLEKNTIDLKFKTKDIESGKLGLYAGGKDDNDRRIDVLFVHIDMSKIENRNKFNLLLNEMKRLNGHGNGNIKSFIVECGWDVKGKQWRLIQNRPDKHIPNFITVCNDTLRVLMDNVTKNELIDACQTYKMDPSNRKNYKHMNVLFTPLIVSCDSSIFYHRVFGNMCRLHVISKLIQCFLVLCIVSIITMTLIVMNANIVEMLTNPYKIAYTKDASLRNNIYKRGDNSFLYINNSNEEGLIFELPKLPQRWVSHAKQKEHGVTFGISIWFRHNLTGKHTEVPEVELVSINSAGRRYSISFIGPNKYLFFRVQNDNGNDLYNSSQFFYQLSNRWFHCMVTYNDKHNTTRFFIDGQLVQPQSTSSCDSDIKLISLVEQKNYGNNIISFGGYQYDGHIARFKLCVHEENLDYDARLASDDFLYDYDMKFFWTKYYKVVRYYFPIANYQDDSMKLYEVTQKDEYEPIHNIDIAHWNVIKPPKIYYFLIGFLLIPSCFIITAALRLKYWNCSQRTVQRQTEPIHHPAVLIFGINEYVFTWDNLKEAFEDAKQYNALFSERLGRSCFWGKEPTTEVYDVIKVIDETNNKDESKKNFDASIVCIAGHGDGAQNVVLSDGISTDLRYIRRILYHNQNICGPNIFFIDKCRNPSWNRFIILYFYLIIIMLRIWWWWETLELSSPAFIFAIIDAGLCCWCLAWPAVNIVGIYHTITHSFPYICETLCHSIILLYLFKGFYNMYRFYVFLLFWWSVACYIFWKWSILHIRCSNNSNYEVFIYGVRDGATASDENTFSKRLVRYLQNKINRHSYQVTLREIIHDLNCDYMPKDDALINRIKISLEPTINM